MNLNKRVAIVMPSAWISAIPSGLRETFAKSGIHIVRDELKDAYHIAGVYLDIVFKVGVPDHSEAVQYLETRVRWLKGEPTPEPELKTDMDRAIAKMWGKSIVEPIIPLQNHVKKIVAHHDNPLMELTSLEKDLRAGITIVCAGCPNEITPESMIYVMRGQRMYCSEQCAQDDSCSECGQYIG